MFANCTAVVVDHHWSRRLAYNAGCGVTTALGLRLADQAVPSQTKSSGNGIELGSSGKPGTASAARGWARPSSFVRPSGVAEVAQVNVGTVIKTL
jgi:hypothetical protein